MDASRQHGTPLNCCSKVNANVDNITPEKEETSYYCRTSGLVEQSRYEYAVRNGCQKEGHEVEEYVSSTRILKQEDPRQSEDDGKRYEQAQEVEQPRQPQGVAPQSHHVHGLAHLGLLFLHEIDDHICNRQTESNDHQQAKHESDIGPKAGIDILSVGKVGDTLQPRDYCLIGLALSGRLLASGRSDK